MDETIKIGEYENIDDAYLAAGQYLDLLKVYNREEYDRVIESGVVLIKLTMKQIEEQRK
jgi:hypothetical protein